MKRISEIDAEIQRRAEHHLTQSHLVADYYRIRRRVAYPLPIDRLTIPSMPVAGIEAYPWSVWMLWDLEERIHSLGWFATRSGDERARAAVLEDVRALCRWPAYGQFDRPDLSLGHCGRLLWYAYRSWEWVREPLQEEFQTAFSRLIEEGLPLSDGMFGPYRSKADVLALEQPHTVLHNIPFIGTVGVALCAACIDHPRRGDLDERLFALLSSILDLRQDGHSEGVGYDGYILDFVAPWLGELDEDRRGEILSHPRFNDVLDESIGLGVPGDVACVAEIGDVEPREMPYHLSGHAKLLKWTGESHRSWLLNHARLDWLRTDALAAIRDLDLAIQDNPVPGAIDCHYAVCLRSGWENQDLAVVVSVSNSPMSHLQCDTGTIVIGTRGRWLISDPGYQQYLKKTERLFTLGETAHNAPVINGCPQSQKAGSRTFDTLQVDSDMWRLTVDLTSCYTENARISHADRQVWLADRDTVVVCDTVSADSGPILKYHWHGHPDAAWWIEEGQALLYLDGTRLWVTCAGQTLEDGQIDRLPGSRGQLTLSTEIADDIVWWVFTVGDRPSVVQEDKGLRVDERIFSRSVRSDV